MTTCGGGVIDSGGIEHDAAIGVVPRRVPWAAADSARNLPHCIQADNACAAVAILAVPVVVS